MVVISKRRQRRSTTEPTLTRRLFSCAFWCGLVGFAIFWVLGSLHIRKHVTEKPCYEYANWQIDFVDFPEWVTPEIRRTLETVDLHDDESNLTLFDRGVLDLVKARFDVSPWVRHVDSLSLAYPNAALAGVIGVDLRLRRPLALVEHEGLHYLVDRDGRRLGSPYREAPTAWFGVPSIVGARVSAPPDEGEEWTASDIAHGLRVAEILRDEGILDDFATRPIKAIDVSNLDGRVSAADVEISLVWEKARLTWGRSPLSAAPSTVGVRQILDNLRRVLNQPRKYGGHGEIHLHRREMTYRRQPVKAVRTADIPSSWPVPSSGPMN